MVLADDSSSKICNLTFSTRRTHSMTKRVEYISSKIFGGRIVSKHHLLLVRYKWRPIWGQTFVKFQPIGIVEGSLFRLPSSFWRGGQRGFHYFNVIRSISSLNIQVTYLFPTNKVFLSLIPNTPCGVGPAISSLPYFRSLQLLCFSLDLQSPG